MAITASNSEPVSESAECSPDKPNDEEKQKKFGTMTWRERTIYVREVITIEPLLTCYLLASVVCGPALYALEFEKACKANEDYNDTICDAILDSTFADKNFTEYNKAVQQRILDMHSWQQPLQNIVPVILVLFLGSYSDRHKIRKPFLLLPMFGELFAVAGCILSVIFMRQWPLEVQGVVQTVVPSFLGGPTMIIMACFAYIADVSTLEMRTIRVGVVQIVLNLCTPIVQSFSGILFATIGYIGVLLIAGLLYLIGILYGFFWIKEPKNPVNVNKKSLIKDVLDPTLAIETFDVLLKREKGNQRLGIVLILFVMFIYSGVVNAEGSVFFLFTQAVYQWTVVEFSYLVTVNTVVHLVGTIIGLPLFTKILNLNDLVITVITFVDKIICNVIFVTISTSTGLYIGTIVSIAIGISSITIRSQMTKVVSENDLGKAQSLFAIIEAVAPAVLIPLYNKAIYSNTQETFPGMFFIVGVLLYVIGIALLLKLYLYNKKVSATVEKDKQGQGIELDNGKVNEGFEANGYQDVYNTHM